MGTRTTCEHAGGLESVRRRFEQWRRTRQGNARIPDTLWTAAVRAAGEHGLCETLRALRLNYYSLKKRVEQQASPGREAARGAVGRRRSSARRGRGRRGVRRTRTLPALLERSPSIAPVPIAAGRGGSSARKRSGGRSIAERRALPTFVEWAPSAVDGLAPAPAGAFRCVVEWENAAGAKMRVEVTGAAMPDLVALSQSFWGSTS
jgi:hypothetical protein